MPIFDFLSGQFIDVIAWTDDSRDTMVWRFERHGHEIKYGAKLTVREGQMAVFIHEGQLADVFTPGLYMLETNNMPVMTSLQHWDHGFRSPFKSEIYFVNTNRFTNLKWGTKNPIMLRDPEFGPTRIRAFGTYTVKVKDAARFMTEIVGTDGDFTRDEVSFQIRNIIVQAFSRVVAASGIPVLDMAANTGEMGKILAAKISETIDQYGLVLPELYIENISLPPAVEAALDKRTSMGVVGDLGRYQQFAVAEAMQAAAANPGGDGGMGAGLGMGMGMAMAGQMANAGPWGAQSAAPAQAAPPPPPVEHVWHIAEAGETKGPFSKAALGRMAASGALTRDTLVWTAGQDGWKPADEVTELAQLFTVMPPPAAAAARKLRAAAMTRRGICQTLHWAQFALLLGLVATGAPSAPWVMAYACLSLGWAGMALFTGLVGRPGPKLDALGRGVHQWGHRALYLCVAASGGLAFAWLFLPGLALQYWLFLLLMLSLLHGIFHLWRHTALGDRALCMILPRAVHGIL